MTHTRQMRDDEGKFATAKHVNIPCRYCGAREVELSVWESNDGAFEDDHYTCRACQRDWWVDGIDS